MSDDTRSTPLKRLRMVVPDDHKQIGRLKHAGNFPRPIDLGDGRVGWLESEIIEWMRSRPVPEFPTSDDDTK